MRSRLCAVAVVAACASTAGPEGELDAGVVSLERELVPIFRASCGSGDMACHSAFSYDATLDKGCRGWLALEDRAIGSLHPSTRAPTGCPDRTLHERLTELTGWLCAPERRYVSSELEQSLLYAVTGADPSMGGTCQRRPGLPLGVMPPPGSGYALPDASRRAIAAWIAAGAQDN